MQLEDIRAFATALPGVEERPHFGRPAFRVRDKLFVSVHIDETDRSAIVHVEQTAAAAAALDAPEVLEEVWRTHGGKRLFVGLRIDLSKVEAELCRTLIQQAWRYRAPKRLAASHDER